MSEQQIPTTMQDDRNGESVVVIPGERVLGGFLTLAAAVQAGSTAIRIDLPRR